MAKSILQMVNAAQAELGLPQSTSVFGSGGGLTDATGIQMGALANRILDELRRMNRWTAQQFEFDLVVQVPTTTTGDMAAQSAVITNIPSTAFLQANYWQVSGSGIPPAARVLTVDSLTQVTMNMENTNTTNLTAQSLLFMKDTYPVPSGFDWFNNSTMWDRTNHWRLIGPDSPQQDQYQRSGIVPMGPRRHFRKVGPYPNTFRIWPPPAEITSPLQLVFEYLSIDAVAVLGDASDGATFAQYFVNDSDTSLLDENAIINGIKWLFKRRPGC